jgi:hypothetical protein
MTEDQVERLRQAGISDEVIRDMMSKDQAAPSAAYIDPATPSETFAQATTAGAPVAGPETTGTQLATEAALLVPDALKYAGGGALGLYAAKKIGGALGGKTPTVAPAVTPASSPVVPNAGPQLPAANTPEGMKQTLRGGPIQPGTNPYTPAQPPAQGPSILQRATDMAGKMRDIAASRVVAAAPTIANIAGKGSAAAMAFVPGNVGQNYPFPTSGPMRGQEINPATGRPWTAAELQEYNAQMR